MDEKEFGFGTRCVRGGYRRDPTTGAATVPICQSAAFVFPDAGTAARRFDLMDPGPIYTRIGNPTTEVLEARLALLDGGVAAVALASGQAAIALTALTLAGKGGSIVSTAELYGGTRTLFANTLPEMGIDVRFISATEPEAVRRVADDTTRAVYCEMLANPSLVVPDLEQFAAEAHAVGVPLVVDNTAATPALCRPLEHGADLVVYSATKFLGGHGTSLGGAVVDGGRFDWRAGGKYPGIAGPDVAYHGLDFTEAFGTGAFAAKLRARHLRDLGPCLSPFNAFLLLQGLETLHLRMPRHCDTALRLARHLAQHPAVAWVNYPGLEGHPSRERAKRYFAGTYGALLGFGVRGGRDAARRLVEALELVLHAANIGDARTVAIHPASTTHRQLDDEERRAAGVPDDAIRVSVGLEDFADLARDFDRALAAAGGGG